MPVFTCKNHRNKLWFNTHEGGKIVFMGEVQKDGSIKDAAPIAPIAHMRLLKAYVNGYNPFDESIQEEPQFKTIEDLRNFLKYVDMQEAKYSFECDCPPGNLEKIPGEPGEMFQHIRAS